MTFTAVPKLWSIGATLYHAAAGDPPFVLKNGRKGYKAAYLMMTKKKANHISAQELENGKIIWSANLPGNAIGKASKGKIEKYLAGLLTVCYEKKKMTT